MGERDPALVEALSRRLATKHVADACGITSQAVSRWQRVPARYVTIVAAITGTPRSRLRPDLYPPRRRPVAAE